MKTLSGVGAVVLGAMLLLTVKIGPAEAQPDSSRTAKIDPMAAVAAVPGAPPRSTPAAAAPVPQPELRLLSERGRVIVVREKKKESARTELPEPMGCSFTFELPNPISPVSPVSAL
jgi:hypothetical protein